LVIGIFLLAYSLYLYKDISLGSDYWFLFWPQVIRGVGIGLVNAPLMSTALNSIRREQISLASGVFAVIMQVGGAFGVAMLGTILQRRQFFHYFHYLEQINNAFSPSGSRALSIMQELLLRYGHGSAGISTKAKGLLALWISQQASVAGFQDAFVLLGFFIAIGILPALLIRKAVAPPHENTIGRVK
jgi:DHA2 family multidrug resistance protein